MIRKLPAKLLFSSGIAAQGRSAKGRQQDPGKGLANIPYSRLNPLTCCLEKAARFGWKSRESRQGIRFPKLLLLLLRLRDRAEKDAAQTTRGEGTRPNGNLAKTLQRFRSASKGKNEASLNRSQLQEPRHRTARKRAAGISTGSARFFHPPTTHPGPLPKTGFFFLAKPPRQQTTSLQKHPQIFTTTPSGSHRSRPRFRAHRNVVVVTGGAVFASTAPFSFKIQAVQISQSPASHQRLEIIPLL